MSSNPLPPPTPLGPYNPPRWSSEGSTVSYRPPLQAPRPKLWLHLALFLATVASTSYFVSPAYSGCLMLILTAHEFGHYFAARHYRVRATLPYFMPFPSLLGTLGAVIRMSPYIPNRRALFDIAAAGPLAGLVFALPVSIVGMMMSEVRPSESMGSFITLGDPLIFRAMEYAIFGTRQEGYDLLLHDVAFAGWVGMFVTALNLLPISQLDGGHINYALFGEKSFQVARAAFGALALLTVFYSLNYVLILLLLWYFGIKHPPTMDDSLELGPQRRKLGYLLAVIFILCFTPAPFQM